MWHQHSPAIDYSVIKITMLIVYFGAYTRSDVDWGLVYEETYLNIGVDLVHDLFKSQFIDLAVILISQCIGAMQNK